MRSAFTAIAIGILACVIGIASAYIVLDGSLRFGKVQLGQWDVWPLAGEQSADPYTKAYLARGGTVWMTVTEGLSLSAVTDSDGEPLIGSCTYVLSGRVPRGRLWTLTPHSIARGGGTGSFNPGFNIRDAATGRDGGASGTVRTARVERVESSFISSSDVVWNEDETLTIAISRKAEPGNWLRLSNTDRFRLLLRIYDTPLTSGALDSAIRTPVIIRRDCA